MSGCISGQVFILAGKDFTPSKEELQEANEDKEGGWIQHVKVTTKLFITQLDLVFKFNFLHQEACFWKEIIQTSLKRL